MSNFRSLTEIFKRVSTSSSTRVWIIALVSFIFLIFLLRTCTRTTAVDKGALIGQDSRWSELNLLGKERNVTAFNSDLLSAIAVNDKISLRLIVGAENQLRRELQNGEIQGILTSLKPSFQNQNSLVFSKPYFLIGPVLAISASAQIQGWNDKAKKFIGVPSNSPASLFLEKDPTLQLKLYGDLLQALSDLNDQRIDGVVFPALQTYIYVQAFYKDRIRIVTTPLNDDGIRLAALNNEEGKQLIERFNKGLETIRANGTYDELLTRWGLFNVEKVP